MITLMTFKYKTVQVLTVFKNEIHKLITHRLKQKNHQNFPHKNKLRVSIDH